MAGGTDGRISTVQETHRFAQVERGEHPKAVDGQRLSVIRERHHERADPSPPARESDGERPADALNVAV